MKTTTRGDGNGGSIEETTVEIDLHDKLRALDKLDSATGAFRKHNPGMAGDAATVKIYVNTNIPGAPGSLVRRDSIDVSAEVVSND